jgi:hypothetical protein
MLWPTSGNLSFVMKEGANDVVSCLGCEACAHCYSWHFMTI